jgi:hypothetical protein
MTRNNHTEVIDPLFFIWIGEVCYLWPWLVLLFGVILSNF